MYIFNRIRQNPDADFRRLSVQSKIRLYSQIHVWTVTKINCLLVSYAQYNVHQHLLQSSCLLKKKKKTLTEIDKIRFVLRCYLDTTTTTTCRVRLRDVRRPHNLSTDSGLSQYRRFAKRTLAADVRKDCLLVPLVNDDGLSVLQSQQTHFWIFFQHINRHADWLASALSCKHTRLR